MKSLNLLTLIILVLGLTVGCSKPRYVGPQVTKAPTGNGASIEKPPELPQTLPPSEPEPIIAPLPPQPMPPIDPCYQAEGKNVPAHCHKKKRKYKRKCNGRQQKKGEVCTPIVKRPPVVVKPPQPCGLCGHCKPKHPKQAQRPKCGLAHPEPIVQHPIPTPMPAPAPRPEPIQTFDPIEPLPPVVQQEPFEPIQTLPPTVQQQPIPLPPVVPIQEKKPVCTFTSLRVLVRTVPQNNTPFDLHYEIEVFTKQTYYNQQNQPTHVVQYSTNSQLNNDLPYFGFDYSDPQFYPAASQNNLFIRKHQPKGLLDLKVRHADQVGLTRYKSAEFSFLEKDHKNNVEFLTVVIKNHASQTGGYPLYFAYSPSATSAINASVDNTRTINRDGSVAKASGPYRVYTPVCNVKRSFVDSFQQAENRLRAHRRANDIILCGEEDQSFNFFRNGEE